MRKLFTTININKFLLLVILAGILGYQLVGGYKYFEFSTDGQILALRLQDFLTLFLSIIVEAFPFVILGVTISTLVGVGFFSWLASQVKSHKYILAPLYLIYFVFSKVDSRLYKNRFYSHIKIS